jgi:hypothetical protein
MSYAPQKQLKSGLNISSEVVDIIVDGMKDSNKDVREAAYSTWVSIVELESDKITDEMIEKITKAIKTYKL